MNVQPAFATQPPSLPSGSEQNEAASFLSGPGLVERTILVVALFTYAWGTPLEWLSFAAGNEVESSAVTQVLFLGFFANTVISMNGNWHVVLAAIKGEPLMAWFIGLITLSSLWSTIPASTFQDGVVLIISYITAIHLVVRFDPKQIIFMLALCFSAGSLLNLGFVAIFDDVNDIVITSGGDGWNGATFNKNTLGRTAVLGALVCAAQARIDRSWLVWPTFAGLNVILVVGSNSATAFGALLGVATLGVVLLGFRGRKTLYGATMVAMLLVFTTLTILSATNLATLTGLLGKDSQFTGRVPIWVNSFDYGILERPFLGFGWGGFWRHGVADFEVQLRANNFDIPHAHNAWVDAWLAVGPLGTILLTAILIRGLIWSTRYIRSTPHAVGLFPALTISLAVIYSSTEAGFVSRSIQFIMFVVATTLASEQKGVRQPFIVSGYSADELEGALSGSPVSPPPTH